MKGTRKAAFIQPLLLCLLALLATPAEAWQLAPLKDRLFGYPDVLERRDDGAYRIIDYREMRDINGRDAVPERRVRGRYVDTAIRRLQRELVIETERGPVRHFAVGRVEGARIITVYLHGQGGNRHQGVDDFTFGGNFNRIKNLMGRNGGLYLVPDVPDFGAEGAARIAAFLSAYAARSPDAPVFLACGSMGGALCWRLAREPALLPRLKGLVLLGSMWDDGFLTTRAFRDRLPIFIGHGSRDEVFPIEKLEAFYRHIRARDPAYPVRFVRFETGTHGTPIRMTDWRETLNWMLSTGR
ncbi:alpha/beta hydrolase [Chelativorans sp. M5D2P16]|uniref:alpha/beta hydrolase n=1 Tax=Chelativorans sp. M5D2P16 TaxID=3095678 RepID=UPI002ACABB75|nr:alpha/beta hydrolase [Chelativorans sp. M5D2P16]MDZ5696467.1 alpha/beta hydrolase [Chelativorans sp. M5D2P16]